MNRRNLNVIFNLLFLVIFVLGSLILLSACSKNGTDGNDNTITVSGKVTLEGESDYSGVMVSLYKPVELDPELVAINQQYPNIGVQISQETEFDHQEETASYNTTTNANGEWSVENVQTGTFHVVITKEGYGWKYLIGNVIDQSKSLNTVGLNKSVILDQGQYNSYNFQSGVYYIIASNSIFNNPTINSDVVFLIENQMRIMGLANADQKVKNVKFLGSANISRVQFQDINSIELENVIFKQIKNNVRFINIQSAVFKNSIIKDATDLLYCNQIQNFEVDQCIFQNSTNGIEFLGSNNLNFHANILWNVNNGIEIRSSDVNVLNNYLKQGNFGFLVHQDGQGNFQHNVFDNIAICALGFYGCYAEVLYNEFTGNSTFFISANAEYVQQSHQQPDVTSKYNNFYASDNTIGINLANSNLLPGDIVGAGTDVNAQNNYWNSTSELSIQEKIVDKQDNNGLGTVWFQPFRTAEIDSAGIF